MFDITIIFLALAVLTFLVLRRALGGRTRRQRPPQRISKPIETSAPTDRYAGIAIPGSPVAKGLDAIMAADGSFDVRHFIDGARAAYQMIVTAYTDGDRRTLTNLLAPEVYEGFEVAMRRREDAGEIAETRLLSVDAADITAAKLRGTTAQITLRFVSELFSATRDRNGAVIGGNADNATSVTDVWTFARTAMSRDPNWKLVATNSGT
jgi:predicted lipid-binding transport protein (Tim44 family)